MKSKGFTLIELLAVIVILAIIALIATPIILNIIEDAKEESVQRSAENYIEAVNLAIAKENMGREFNPSTCKIISNGNLECEGYEGTIKVEVDGEVPTEGTLTFSNGELTDGSFKISLQTFEIQNGKLVLSSQTGDSGEANTLICKAVTEETATKTSFYEVIGYDEEKDESIYSETLTTKTVGNIPAGDGTYKAGDEYICEVGPGITHRFFVLNSTSTTVNLIMDQNINSDGSLPTSGVIKDGDNIYNLLPWITKDDYLANGGQESDWTNYYGNRDKGPITAMNFLEKATANWTNLNKMTISTFEVCDDGEIGTPQNIGKTYKIYARLPYYSEVSEEVTPQALWLINYLDGEYDDTVGEEILGRTKIDGIFGYWTNSSSNIESADFVINTGIMEGQVIDYDYEDNVGVRPVITISTSDIG